MTMRTDTPEFVIYHNGDEGMRTLVAKCMIKKLPYRTLDIRHKNMGGQRENLAFVNQFSGQTGSRVPLMFVEASDGELELVGTFDAAADLLDGIPMPKQGPMGKVSA